MFQLLSHNGKPVQKKRKDCNLQLSVSKTHAQSAEGAVQGAWQVTLHKADQVLFPPHVTLILPSTLILCSRSSPPPF